MLVEKCGWYDTQRLGINQYLTRSAASKHNVKHVSEHRVTNLINVLHYIKTPFLISNKTSCSYHFALRSVRP
jgi:hypothetical protein